MNIFLGILWLAVSLFFLLKSADYFTTYSEKLGKILGIPQFIIGATIIALGTSLPELASSAVAFFKGSPEIVAANVIGSNITNILFVIGLSAIFAKKMLQSKDDIYGENATLMLGGTIFIIMVCLDGQITLIESLFLLTTYIIYVTYSIITRKKTEKDKKTREKISTKIPVIIVISSIFIYFSAEQTINSLTFLSKAIGISSSIIALTVVALGTSLPEAVVSVIASMKGNSDIALGNIIGSNMFNVLFIPGFLGLFGPLSIAQETITIGLTFLGITVLIFLIAFQGNKFHKGEGAIFLLLYIFFIFSLYHG